jgi:hypothetical protein
MHATNVTNARTESQSASEPPATRRAAVDRLLGHLDGLSGVSVTEVDAAVCGLVGCTRSDSRLWRVDVEAARTRTYCPTHAVEFIRDEVGL